MNRPVTGKEVPMKEGTILVSKTDLQGRITYCNNDFVQISGFTESELITQNHNIVRHPDMPAAAFEDLWRTVKQEQPWEGLVKNRAKNGDYYWVHANVTPLFSEGQVIGYMSVRTKPSAQQIFEASSQYESISQLENQGKRSEPESPGWWGRLTANTSLKRKISLFVLAAAVLQALLITATLLNAPVYLLATLALLPFLPILLGARALNTQLNTPLTKVSANLSSILNGHLFDWVDFHRQDEFGDVLRKLRMAQIKLGFDVVDANETVLNLLELLSSLETLTDKFDSTAKSMEESAESISEINTLAKNNSNNLADADKKVALATEHVEHSRDALDQAVASIRTVEESTEQIANFIGVIDEVAFKTNLLALNASVEAAHAGHQGRGFAVVAQEVRNLSQLTTNAAQEIKQLIENNLSKVHEGSQMIENSRDALREVVEGVANVSQLISETALAGQEQTTGVEMLSGNIQSLNNALQDSNDMIQEASYRTSSLKKRANEFINNSRIHPTH